MDSVDAQLDEADDTQTQLVTSKRRLDEDVPKWSPVMENIKTCYERFSKLCDPVYLELLRDQVSVAAYSIDSRLGSRFIQIFEF